ncbi:MAG: hypothetical protein JWO46_1084 [Nocardioidaceae bacterium]|nr:hypothetical protein [Nocardioidaceae bacterium]
MARFKELCLDTSDPQSTIGGFWAAATGGRAEAQDPRYPADVYGAEEYQGIAICPVPEAKTAKNRVHPDVYVRSVDDLVALGATVDRPAEETGFGWTTMFDPEGNEFCAFVRDELPAYRVHGIGVDCADPEPLAHWWAAAYGATVNDNDGRGFWSVEHATPDPLLTLDFAPVPEPRTVKNRMHWDVYGTVEEFTDRGATFLWEVPRGWTVLADPEGNEFCVFPDPTPDLQA